MSFLTIVRALLDVMNRDGLLASTSTWEYQKSEFLRRIRIAHWFVWIALHVFECEGEQVSRRRIIFHDHDDGGRWSVIFRCLEVSLQRKQTDMRTKRAVSEVVFT